MATIRMVGSNDKVSPGEAVLLLRDAGVDVSIAILRTALREGRLKGVCFSNRWAIRRKDLAAWGEARKAGAR